MASADRSSNRTSELESALSAATDVLIAIASGRFDVRAPRRGDGSAADTLTFLVNATAEEVERLVADLAREREELEHVHRQLLQSAKLAALGRLAGGIAHELNQPLTVIRMVTDLLLEHGEARIADRRADLLLLRQAAQSMSAIVSNVRAFARPSAFQLTSVPPLAPLEGALLLVSDELKQLDVSVRREVGRELPAVSADRERLQQVFVNVLTNARDALRDAPLHHRGREISIAVRAVEGCVEYVFTDTGSGIPAEHATRIFDPFFTTKPVGQGTGLGLSVSLGIVRDHGGELRYERIPGTGACFVVRIPAAVVEVER
jgi:two-component system, NtrC family, sensor kinase